MLLPIHPHRGTGDKTWLGEEGEGAVFHIFRILVQMAEEVLRDSRSQPLGGKARLVAGGENGAVLIADQHIRVNEPDGSGEIVVKILPVHIQAHDHQPSGQNGHIVRLLVQSRLPVPEGKLIAQRHKRGAQKGEGEQNHARCQGKVALKQGIHRIRPSTRTYSPRPRRS